MTDLNSNASRVTTQQVRVQLSRSQAWCFNISKFLACSTLSSPFRILRLLLQSRRAIVDKCDEASSIKIPPIIGGIDNILQHQNTNVVSYKYLNLFHSIIQSKQLGMSYLFLGNVYYIMKTLTVSPILEKMYGFGELTLEKSKDEQKREFSTISEIWGVATSVLFISSFIFPNNDISHFNPLKIFFSTFSYDNKYLNLLLNRNGNNNSTNESVVEIADGKWFFKHNEFVASMTEVCLNWFVYGIFVDTLLKNYQEYNIEQRLKQQTGLNVNRFARYLIKYIGLTCSSIISYPFSTIKIRQSILTNETMKQSFRNIKKDNNNWGQLYDGFKMYLLEQFIIHMCSDIWEGLKYITTQKTLIIVHHLNAKNSNININTSDEEQKNNFNFKDKPNQLECGICFRVSEENYVFPNCGHFACGECKQKIRECHVCRADIRGAHRLYI